MASYRGIVDPKDRAAAIAAVVAVHGLLAAIILTGLNVNAVRRAVETMTTISIVEPPPPPPLPPPKQAERAKQKEGAAGKKAEPTKVVAPPSPIPRPSPIAAAPVAGAGNAPRAGAASAGSGTGAGGSGSGRGGGGTGDTSGFTPPRLVRNIGRGDYQLIAGGRLPVGSADVAIAITPSGAVNDCRLVRSSGDAAVDRGLCPLLVERLRFRPALDDAGRPIGYRTNYHASWRLGRW